MKYLKKKENQNGKEQWREVLVSFYLWQCQKMQEMKEYISNNRGVGIVEIAMLILIVVALALVFRDKISTLLEDIFQKIDLSKFEN